MTGGTVPGTDLLASIDRIEKVERGILQVGIDWRDRDLIVRGVRDLAARVETLERAIVGLNGHAYRCNVYYNRKTCSCGLDAARAALAGQSTTEQP